MQPLYNREGRAIAYIADNGISIYFYDGSPAGWVYQDSLVFAYSGRFLGWLMYGWLCDPAGNPALFTDKSSGGPKRPVKQPRPIRSSRDARPPRRPRQVRPPRPGMTATWSEHSDESLFAVPPGEVEAAVEAGADETEAGDPPEAGAPPESVDAPESVDSPEASDPPKTPDPREEDGAA